MVIAPPGASQGTPLKHLIVPSLLACAFSFSTVIPTNSLTSGLQAAESSEAPLSVTDASSAGVTWLSQQQQADGSFTSGTMFKVGITALSTLSLLENGVAVDDPRIVKALEYLKNFQQPDGGIYDPSEGLSNYGTSITLMLLAKAGMNDSEVVKKAQEYLIGTQNMDADSPLNGGFAYNGSDKGRADLSNTSMVIEALRNSGIPADHPAMKRALGFVERCQNLTSVNKAPWAGNDGSAVYAPDPKRRGGSFADGSADGESASGSGGMTYALIKSYILLDVPADDPRIQTALKWVSDNFQFDQNPGLAAQRKEDGLFYYYLLMATTLNRSGLDSLTTADGDIPWRERIGMEIAKRAQAVDGKGAFWINNSKRWGEGIPQLTTAYMLRALAHST